MCWYIVLMDRQLTEHSGTDGCISPKLVQSGVVNAACLTMSASAKEQLGLDEVTGILASFEGAPDIDVYLSPLWLMSPAKHQHQQQQQQQQLETQPECDQGYAHVLDDVVMTSFVSNTIQSCTSPEQDTAMEPTQQAHKRGLQPSLVSPKRRKTGSYSDLWRYDVGL